MNIKTATTEELQNELTLIENFFMEEGYYMDTTPLEERPALIASYQKAKELQDEILTELKLREQ